MSYPHYIKEFMKHFLIGGTVIGLYSLVTKYISPGYSTQVASSLPIVVSYIVVLTYYEYGINRSIKISYLAFFAGLVWQLYVLMLYLGLRNKLGVYPSIIICVVVYLIISILFYQYFKDYY